MERYHTGKFKKPTLTKGGLLAMKLKRLHNKRFGPFGKAKK